MKYHFYVFFLLALPTSWAIEPSYNRYVPEVHFFISLPEFLESEAPYREIGQDIIVGTQFRLVVCIKIKCGLFSKMIHSDKGRTIPVTVTIPNTELFEYRLADTDTWHSKTEDNFNNIVKYTFNVHADTDPKEIRAEFRCKALEKGVQKVTVEFPPEIVHRDHRKETSLFYVENKTE